LKEKVPGPARAELSGGLARPGPGCVANATQNGENNLRKWPKYQGVILKIIL